MLLYTLKNEKFKKPKKLMRPGFIVFFFFWLLLGGFFQAGFLMPTLLVTAQPISYLRPDKSK